MDTVRFICSAPVVIFLSLIFLVLFYKTGITPMPGDATERGLGVFFNYLHDAILPGLFLYWSAAFCINRFQ